MMSHVAALLALSLTFACNTPAATQVPEGPSNTTEFHISVMNACTSDMLLKLAEGPGAAGREQLLIQNQRDTVTGTRELVHLIGKDGEVLATYRPVQGKQKLTISSDCSALVRDD